MNLMGWGLLIVFWYKFIFNLNFINKTLNAIEIIFAWSLLLFVFQFLWDWFNLEDLIFRSKFNKKFIRIKVKERTWADISIDASNNIINKEERFTLICSQKEQRLSPARMQSYAGLLIRNRHVIEAVGFLRQMINDPYIGQLARKIAENQLS